MRAMRQALWLFGLVAGCAQPLVEDTFTPEQWAQLQRDFRVPAHDPCNGTPQMQCDQLAQLGRDLFFDASLSGELTVDDPNGLGAIGEPGRVACASCHDPSRYYVDIRSQPGNVSLGTARTKHNALTVVNVSLKAAIAGPKPAFTWIGAAGSARDVFDNLALPNAMHGSGATVSLAVRSNHLTAYEAVFFDDATDDALTLQHVGSAFDAYEARLVSVDSPFDKFLAGDDSALTPQQRHGFELFAGPGICIECHRGPLLTDLEFHVTGVAQTGPNVPAQDDGRFSVTKDPADEGAFLTPSLRNVAMTAPYMHAGQFATLDDVVAFYRRGGDDSGFAGTRDPRIVPLDMTDDDAADLVAFLGALTGSPPDPQFGALGN